MDARRRMPLYAAEMLLEADIYFALAGPLVAILMVAVILVLNLRSCVLVIQHF